MSEVTAWLRARADAMVELTGELVSAESPSDDADALAAAADLLVERGNELLGVPAVQLGTPTAPALTWSLPAVRSNGRPVVLLAHLDTVWATGRLSNEGLGGRILCDARRATRDARSKAEFHLPQKERTSPMTGLGRSLNAPGLSRSDGLLHRQPGRDYAQQLSSPSNLSGWKQSAIPSARPAWLLRSNFYSGTQSHSFLSLSEGWRQLGEWQTSLMKMRNSLIALAESLTRRPRADNDETP